MVAFYGLYKNITKDTIFKRIIIEYAKLHVLKNLY